MDHSPVPRIHERYPYSWYREMRATTPVFFNQQQQTWNVFLYEDVEKVLTEYTTFSSDLARWQRGTTSMATSDPPQHNVLRALVSQAFTPRSIAELVPRIRAIVNSLLDQVIASGRMDIIQDLAYPLPTIVISELLGVPRADHPQLKIWIDAFVISAGKGNYLPSSGPAMAEYFQRLIQQRRQQPENDLISRLLVAQADGHYLTVDDVISLCKLIFIAGYETTTYLLGNAIECFAQNPEVMEIVRREPALLPDAIEEVLRYHTPVHAQYRIVARDTTLRGQRISEGQFIIPWIASSGHDETVFVGPERFDITRQPNRHLAFGHGVHFCLGAPLARLEAQIALQAIFERFSALRLVEDVPLERVQSIVIHGVKNLPVTFSV